MIAWSRLAMARSDPFIAAILASRALSPSALFLFARSSAFSSRARSLIAARSASENLLDDLPIAVVLLADFFVAFLVALLADFFVPFFGLIKTLLIHAAGC